MTAPDKADLGRWLPGFFALAAIWGSSFLFIKLSVAELHPLYATLGRVLAGALTLLLVLAVLRVRLPRNPVLWGHLAVVAAVGVVVPFTLFGYGEQRIPSLLAGIWNATTPLVVLPMAVLAFRTERLTARRAIGLATGFVGVLVVLGAWRGLGGAEFTGQLMCFAAAVCYGVAIPYQKRFIAGRAESGVALAAGQLVMALAQLLIVAPLVVGAPPALGDLSLTAVGSVVLLGVFGTGLAFVINLHNIRVAGASTASMVTYLVPIVAVLIGVLVLDESLTWYQPVGALIVLTGVAVSQGLFAGRTRRVPPPSPLSPPLSPPPSPSLSPSSPPPGRSDDPARPVSSARVGGGPLQ